MQRRDVVKAFSWRICSLQNRLQRGLNEQGRNGSAPFSYAGASRVETDLFASKPDVESCACRSSALRGFDRDSWRAPVLQENKELFLFLFLFLLLFCLLYDLL